MSNQLTIRVTPFKDWGDDPGSFSSSWQREYHSLDGTATDEFRAQDIDEVLYQADTGDDWDGKAAAVFRLKDGRLIAYETFWGPTGDGFNEDAYGGNATLEFASELRLLVNSALTDEARRLLGIPEELWNG